MLRSRWPIAIATAVCAVAWAALASATVLSDRPIDVLPFAAYLLAAAPLGLGWVIAVRAPANPVGPALAWLAAFLLATPAVETWGETSSAPSPWWGAGTMAVIGAGAWPWHLVGFLILLLVFPDGLLPGRRWRVLAVLVPVSALAVNAAFVVTMNYHTPRPRVRSPVSVAEVVWVPVQIGALAMLLVIVLACCGSLVIRYRQRDERVRQQLRWLLLSAGGVVLLMVGSWGLVASGWAGPGAYIGFLAGIVVLVPTAVAIAVLRYDLFEIDRLLSDSLAWLLTSVVAAVTLAGSVVLIGYVVGRDSVLGLTGAVFVVAMALLPVHRRIHRLVGRVLDRDRTVLIDRMQHFVDEVRDGSAEPEVVEEVLRSVTGDTALRLFVTDPGGRGYVDLSGRSADPAGDQVRMPLRTADVEVGLVMVSAGSMRKLRRARLAASAARLPIEVSRLRLGLRRALSDVDESRRRLVSATIGERQRLERDLHDGAQQQLVAIGMQLRAAQRLLASDHAVYCELDQAVARLEHTVIELRQLAHGIRPASLDDGLPAALRRLAADCPIPVAFSVADSATSELVATTAYFVVAEAMANVLKHASASEISVEVRNGSGQLHVVVSDNGIGGAPAQSGMTALHDRVSSIGGRLTVSSQPNAGTRIEAMLPCA